MRVVGEEAKEKAGAGLCRGIQITVKPLTCFK